MKKVTVIIAVSMLTGLTAYGQNFGLKAGVNWSKFDGMEEYSSETPYGSESMKMKYIPGYNAGVTFEYGFNDNMGITTGLGLTAKGTLFSAESDYTYEDETHNSMYETKISLTYLEVPLNFKAGFMVKNVKIYGLLGGTFNLGLFGKYDMQGNSEWKNGSETYSESYRETESIRFDEDEDGMELPRVAFGVAPGIGVEVKNFQFEFNYNIGMNVFEDDWTQRTLSVNVGYKFGNKKG